MNSLKLLMTGIASEIDYHEEVALCVGGNRNFQELISEVQSHVVMLSEAQEPFIADSASRQFLGTDLLLCQLLQAVRHQPDASWFEHSSITYKEMKDCLELSRMLMWRMTSAFLKTRSLEQVIFEGERTARQFNMRSMVVAGRGHEDCIINGCSRRGVVRVERIISDLSQGDYLVNIKLDSIPDASWVFVFNGHKVDPRWKTSVRQLFAGYECQNETVLRASKRLNALLIDKLVYAVENSLQEACEDLCYELPAVYKEDWFDGTIITAFLNYKGNYYFAQLGDSGFLITRPEGYRFSCMHRLSNPKKKNMLPQKLLLKNLLIWLTMHKAK